MNIENYRIKRIDPKNIALQRRQGKRWISVSYHGNSLSSLLRALSELVMAQYTPENDDVIRELKRLEDNLEISLSKIRDLLEDRWE